jgi:hypothetical protein
VSRGRVRRPVLAARKVRKATRNGSCVLCGKPVNVGQTVGLVAAGWAHQSPCLVQRQQLSQLITPESK